MMHTNAKVAPTQPYIEQYRLKSAPVETASVPSLHTTQLSLFGLSTEQDPSDPGPINNRSL